MGIQLRGRKFGGGRSARCAGEGGVGTGTRRGFKTAGPAPYKPQGKLLEDAIKRARTGQGEQYETGVSYRRNVDVETQQAVAEYNPMNYLPAVGTRPVLLIVAEKDELINNQRSPRTFFEQLTGPKDYIEVKGITHFEMYIGEAFERSSNAAAEWFLKYL